MTTQPHLRVVTHGGAPPPLLPPDVDLGDMPEVMLNIQWLCDSRFSIIASPEEFGAAVRLHARSQHEKPAATLPENDAELAFLAGYGRDVRAWLMVKAVAMEGWTLCSDGRFYRRDMAVKALSTWIKLISNRRKQAKSSAGRKGAEFNSEPYDRANTSACNALYALDPQAKILRNHMNADPDLAPALADQRAPGTASDNDPVSHKGKEPKGTETSDYISSTGRSPVEAGCPGQDSRSGSAGSRPSQDRTPVPPWPATAWQDWWVLWPNKVGKEDAMQVFAEMARDPPLPFEQMIAAVVRYADGKPPGYAWKYPATWLNKRSWTDEWPDKAPPRGQAPSGSKYRGSRPFQPTTYRGRPM
ncbi:hypothetical protein [Lichenihabitans psoromatis]|uniref:hypothetical protein n=1 Tax=Lichenihabitans psoromatis TaxID=2528642 RepID=UPI001035C979|nr:hypothetical protein [Lichenihabitans psoromatis]